MRDNRLYISMTQGVKAKQRPVRTFQSGVEEMFSKTRHPTISKPFLAFLDLSTCVLDNFSTAINIGLCIARTVPTTSPKQFCCISTLH